MKRWIRWAAWLYPAEWRVRYGAEFDVLLDDAGLQWSDLADVIRGAVIMQMTTWMSYWKMALLAGIAGAILAGGASFAIPDQYVCTASLEFLNNSGARESFYVSHARLVRALVESERAVLGRDALIALLKDPVLDLYGKERQRWPVQEVAEGVFRKHVHLIPLGFTSHDSDGQAFRIVFQYPDRFKARAVVERLSAAFRDQVRQQEGVVLTVLEQPFTPERPTSPMRASIALIGAITGMIMGLISLKVWRRTRTYAVVTMSIPKDTKQFVERQMAAGQYRSVSDYVRALILADEQRNAARRS